MNHIMLDLETMSTAPDAAIVQIGAVRFDLEKGIIYAPPTVSQYSPTQPPTGNWFERTVALQSSLLAGGRIDPETVAWWQEQSRPRISIESNAERLMVVLGAFSGWYSPGAILWSHGAAFDVPVLESAYRRLEMKVPWSYRDVRDTRTLFWLAELAGWEKPKRETAHTALADAVAQAGDVCAAYRWSQRNQSAIPSTQLRHEDRLNADDCICANDFCYRVSYGAVPSGRRCRWPHDQKPPLPRIAG